MKLEEAREIKTVGEVWAIYKKIGLTVPHINKAMFFEDAQILQKLFNQITELETQRDELAETAYRAGVEDGWMIPEGNLENMAYEYIRGIKRKK